MICSTLNQSQSGGTRRFTNIDSLPIGPLLRGLGISSELSELDSHAIYLSHVHPRASELLHVLNGSLITGLLEENTGLYMENNLQAKYSRRAHTFSAKFRLYSIRVFCQF